jgi:hypothetical protein
MTSDAELIQSSAASDSAAVSDRMPPGADEIIQLGLGFWTSQVLLCAVELGLFTELAGTPLDGETLRARLGLHQRGARDFFDVLVSLGLLQRAGDRYRNSASAERLLNRANETYIGGLLEIAHVQWYASWGNLITALRDGKPQNGVTSGSPDTFAALYSDPERAEKFSRAMTGGAMTCGMALAERPVWAKVRTVADIGSSEGGLLSQLLRRHEHLAGTGFDLPEVADSFNRTAAEAGLADRMSFAPGSFFTDPLPAADVIIYGHVLHDWDLETKRLLLGKAFEALPPGGLVMVYDTLIDDERSDRTFAMLMSLHMLLESPGGFDYTGTDCLGWLEDAGFRDCRVDHLTGPNFLVVGRKP